MVCLSTFGCCLTVNAGEIYTWTLCFFGLQGPDRYISITRPKKQPNKEIPTDTWNIPQTQKTTGL